MIPDLTHLDKCDTFVYMEQIKTRDLPVKTGEWVRRAARGEGIVIAERGRPTASLLSFCKDDLSRSLRERQLLAEFDALPVVSGDAMESRMMTSNMNQPPWKNIQK